MLATLTGALLVGVSGYASTGDFMTFAGTTAANIFANLATDWTNSICRFGDDAYLRRYKGIDENHVVVRGVREAQLEALSAVLRGFDAARRGHRDPAQ